MASALFSTEFEMVAYPTLNQTTGGDSEGLRAEWIGGIGPQSRADHRPTGCKRSSGPPDVQSRDVPVPNGLLPSRMRGDALDGKVHFDKPFGVRHLDSGWAASRIAEGLTKNCSTRTTGFQSIVSGFCTTCNCGVDAQLNTTYSQ